MKILKNLFRQKWVRIVTGILLVLAAIGALRNIPWGGTGGDSEAKVGGADSLRLYSVERREVRDELEILGQIVFKEKVAIASKVEGRIAKIYVDAGDKVGSGGMIAQIERLPLEIQLKQQQAELDIARKAHDLSKAKFENALKGIEIKFRMIEKARAEVNDKKVSYENMDRVIKNKTILYEAGGVTESELKTMKAQHTTVFTQYEVAKADLEIQLVGYRDEDIMAAGYGSPKNEKERLDLIKKINTRIEKAELDSALSRIKQAENNVQATEIMLKETAIRSPLSGVVAAKNMEAGEMVKADSIIAVVMNVATVYVSMNVNEKELARIKQGQKVTFTVDALGDEKFTAVIRRLTPLLDTKTRTMEVKAEMPNPKGRLAPGMFARAVIGLGGAKEALVVPMTSIVKRDGDKGTVYLVKKGIVFTQKVALGSEYKEDIEITSGLHEKDVIIAAGVHTAYPGMTVTMKVK